MSSTTIDEVAEKEGRRIKRYTLSLPTRVEVKVDAKYSWNEITRVQEVSAFGAGFVLKRPIKRGRLLVLGIPMPRQLRCYDYLEPQYRVWGLVRRCISLSPDPAKPGYAIGVAFVGKNPPQSFLEDPAKLFDLSHRDDNGLWSLIEASPEPDEKDLPLALRRHTRFAIPETLILEQLDENGDVSATEQSVTENLSFGGASVFTSFDINPGAFLRVISSRHNIAIIAIVRGKRVGSDGIVRLHVEFIDRLFPLEGVE